jgi:hypothetical protein
VKLADRGRAAVVLDDADGQKRQRLGERVIDDVIDRRERTQRRS